METITTQERTTSFTESQLQDFINDAVLKALKTTEVPLYLTTHEAGMYLGKTETAVRIMVNRKQIKYYKPSKKIYFLKSDLYDYIQSGMRLTSAELSANPESILRISRKVA